MELHLEGKRVLVTGGNSGLGAAMARAFAGEGARVAINYVANQAEAERLATELGAGALAVQADISDAAAVEAMFGRLDAAWGGIDVLINNAGIDGVRAPAWEIGVGDWVRVLNVNLIGAFHCARQALIRMVPQGAGVIINVSSVHEVIPWSGYSAYAASKAGVSALARTLSQEAAPHGVRVLCLAPGAVRTPINRSVWEDPAANADLMAKIPLGRIGTPEEIAGMALVLASEVGAYVTGTSVFVDGGMTDYPAFSHGG